MTTQQDNGSSEYEGFLSPSPLAEQMFDLTTWASEPIINPTPGGGVFLGVVMKVPRQLLTRLKNFIDRDVSFPYENFITALVIKPDDEDLPAIGVVIMVSQFEGLDAKPIWTYFNVADMAEQGQLPNLEAALEDELPLMLSFIDSRLRELIVPDPERSGLHVALRQMVDLYHASPWDAELGYDAIGELMEHRKRRGMHTIDDLEAFMAEIEGTDALG